MVLKPRVPRRTPGEDATTRGSLTRRLSTGPGGGSDPRGAPSVRPRAPRRVTGGRALNALACPRDQHRCADLAIYLHLTEALCRARTGDPFLTMGATDRLDLAGFQGHLAPGLAPIPAVCGS